MAPPPGEQNGGESAAGQGPRSLPTPFLTKTFQLVDDPSIDDVISWNDDGSTFVGFRKVVPDRWEFSNECFRKGEKRLLGDIQRRKVTTPAAVVSTLPAPQGTGSPSNSGEEQVISSNSSPRETSFGSTTELVDENEKAKKREHATQQGIEPDEESVQQYLRFDVELTPVIDQKARLREGEGEAAEQHEELQLQLGVGEVKSEPFDHLNVGDEEETPWLKQCNRTNQRVCN
ncbi:winged-helix DNA-binding transcription factor family protein [Actinidia rufa]|uniref:Winged-helix DNA-binding transcription factor family protein n=1 Tax=Actinidia rufa TaxID=165716 RepID=A0A7J0GWZ3_9ERIC|nr:winged-helix DNA-binding transcription factor family protein [Actinidia rufa]